MFENLTVPTVAIVKTPHLNRVKLVLSKCQVCDEIPWMSGDLWAIQDKICTSCVIPIEKDYQQFKDELTLYEYAETIILANTLAKE